jgi:copper chaperone CopZ
MRRESDGVGEGVSGDRHDLRHCVSSVRGEVGKLSGVESVDVDLASGRVTVSGDGFTDDQVAAAVDEAGYALAGA